VVVFCLSMHALASSVSVLHCMGTYCPPCTSPAGVAVLGWYSCAVICLHFCALANEKPAPFLFACDSPPTNTVLGSLCHACSFSVNCVSTVRVSTIPRPPSAPHIGAQINALRAQPDAQPTQNTPDIKVRHRAPTHAVPLSSPIMRKPTAILASLVSHATHHATSRQRGHTSRQHTRCVCTRAGRAGI
jgi:hypothetical protein